MVSHPNNSIVQEHERNQEGVQMKTFLFFFKGHYIQENKI